MLTQEPEQTVHLAEYYHILVKHRLIIIASLVLLVTLTMLFTFQMKPVYRATATMVIEPEQNTSPLTGERTDYESYVSQSLTFNTHFKLISSDPVLHKVIRTLKLDQPDREDIEVSPWRVFLAQFKKNINLLLGREKAPLTSQEQLAALQQTLRGKIEIEQVRDTRLLKVNVEDHDPVRARDIANTLAESYITFNIDNRLKSSRNTLSWMTDQLYEVKKKLEDAEEEFLAYKQEAKLFSVEGKQRVISQKIQEFNDAYLQTRNKRLELDAKLTELNRLSESRGDLMRVRSLIDNPLIDNLYSQLLDAEIQLSGRSKVYKAKHPIIIELNSKIEKTRKRLAEELQKEIENLKAERTVLLSREQVMAKTISDFEDEGLETNRKELKYTILERNVETNKKLYDTLLSRIKESNIVESGSVSNIRVAEPAVVPVAPVKPKKKLNLLLSIIFGLMTGVGIAFLWEYVDRSLRTEEDVQRYLGVPVLSVVPVAEKNKK